MAEDADLLRAIHASMADARPEASEAAELEAAISASLTMTNLPQQEALLKEASQRLQESRGGGSIDSPRTPAAKRFQAASGASAHSLLAAASEARLAESSSASQPFDVSEAGPAACGALAVPSSAAEAQEDEEEERALRLAMQASLLDSGQEHAQPVWTEAEEAAWTAAEAAEAAEAAAAAEAAVEAAEAAEAARVAAEAEAEEARRVASKEDAAEAEAAALEAARVAEEAEAAEAEAVAARMDAIEEDVAKQAALAVQAEEEELGGEIHATERARRELEDARAAAALQAQYDVEAEAEALHRKESDALPPAAPAAPPAALAPAETYRGRGGRGRGASHQESGALPPAAPAASPAALAPTYRGRAGRGRGASHQAQRPPPPPAAALSPSAAALPPSQPPGASSASIAPLESDTTSDAVLARAMHDAELQAMRDPGNAPGTRSLAAPPAPAPPQPAAACASAPASASGEREVLVVLDALNLCRHKGFNDPEFVGPAREAFERRRALWPAAACVFLAAPSPHSRRVEDEADPSTRERLQVARRTLRTNRPLPSPSSPRFSTAYPRHAPRRQPGSAWSTGRWHSYLSGPSTAVRAARWPHSTRLVCRSTSQRGSSPTRRRAATTISRRFTLRRATLIRGRSASS